MNNFVGQPFGIAHYEKDVFCPHQLSELNWRLWDGNNLYPAGNNLVISCKCIYIQNKTESEFHIFIFHGLIGEGNYGICMDSKPCGEDEGDCDHDGQCKENHKCGSDNCRSSLGMESFYDCCYSLEEDFCTLENPCGLDQGDCDSNVVCLDGLVCGLNNCPDSMGYDSEVDCCYGVIVGDDNFCTSDANPCGVNEGDCDSNNECQANLICDIANNCPAYLGFASDVNCCASGCKTH